MIYDSNRGPQLPLVKIEMAELSLTGCPCHSKLPE